MGSWEEVKMDPQLGLADKIFLKDKVGDVYTEGKGRGNPNDRRLFEEEGACRQYTLTFCRCAPPARLSSPPLTALNCPVSGEEASETERAAEVGVSPEIYPETEGGKSGGHEGGQGSEEEARGGQGQTRRGQGGTGER